MTTLHGNTVYLAGQVADDPTQDTESQTAAVLRKIDVLLAEAGTDNSCLLSCQVFLADVADVAALNRAWDAWLERASPPARATVEAKLVDPRWRVEITAIVALQRPPTRSRDAHTRASGYRPGPALARPASRCCRLVWSPPRRRQHGDDFLAVTCAVGFGLLHLLFPAARIST